MARARCLQTIQNTRGDVQAGLQVEVFEAGTTTPVVQTMWDAAVGGSAIGNPLTTDPDGGVSFFFDTPQYVKFQITDLVLAEVIRTIDFIAVVAPAGAGGLRWQPAHFIGTFDAGETYGFGDAVRADDSGTWKLYISLVDGNIGHDPRSDHVLWQDVVNHDAPVIVEGTANPNTFGEALPTKGGFAASPGSLFIQAIYGDPGAVWTFDDGAGRWSGANLYASNSAEDGVNLDVSVVAARLGPGSGSSDVSRSAARSHDGDGNATSRASSVRGGAGNGDAIGGAHIVRDGTGSGDAQATLDATIDDTAVGIADARASATHHAGGAMTMGPHADADGAYAEITGTLPTTDPHVAGHIWEFTGDIAALTTYLAGGGKLLVRSAG